MKKEKSKSKFEDFFEQKARKKNPPARNKEGKFKSNARQIEYGDGEQSIRDDSIKTTD